MTSFGENSNFSAPKKFANISSTKSILTDENYLRRRMSRRSPEWLERSGILTVAVVLHNTDAASRSAAPDIAAG
jgi:hypothetical protein